MRNKKESSSVGWQTVVKSLMTPKVACMLALGFSSGLPFMLVGNTLGFWLRESGITLTTIGFLSWIGLAYSFKFLWAPLTDKMPLPLLTSRLGQRRGWMLMSQVLVMASLFAMSTLTPAGGIFLFTGLAALAAFSSATQDIVIDAWRIEVSDAGEDMALLSSAYQLGYRISLLITDALILIAAGSIGWAMSYTLMGALMAVGLVATFFAMEPIKNHVTHETKSLGSIAAVYDAVVGPLVTFFKAHGKKAALILAVVSLYRLSDFVMGPMANPFYADLGLAKEVVGAVRGSFGLVASIAGIAAGGLCAVRFGLVKTLLLGAFVGPASNLAFTVLAWSGARNDIFTMAMIIDNFSNGLAGVALVGYMSSLTSMGYTATQYALLSSFYTLLGKFLKGFSGSTVDSLSAHMSVHEAYAAFFAFTAFIGLPSLLLCWWLVKIDGRLLERRS